MFIKVHLLNGMPEPLWYQSPSSWGTLKPGTFVQVPVRAKIEPGLIVQAHEKKPYFITFALKEAHALDPFPADDYYMPFITQLTQYYQIEPIMVLRRMRQFIAQKEEAHETPDHPTKDILSSVQLTDEQQKVVDFIHTKITDNAYAPTLLHGVTGSGKTEVYKNAIIHAYNLRKTSMLLLPEVTLSLQFYKLLQKQLPDDIPIFSFHSATSLKEKRALWQALLDKKPIVIIGVHLPILLPIANLGIIIIDEEHETGYQEKKHPKINTKQAALLRAHHASIPILLGSATPSITSLHAVKTKGWHFFQLKKRFSGSFAQVRTVFLTTQQKRRNFWITNELEKSIADRLAKKEQVIIFLNRRGYSFFVQCKSCSYIFECRNCSVSLTLHASNQLTCHYCGHSHTLPALCPSCQGSEDGFLKKGVGTQQVVTILERIFPHARIGRADMDTTTKKKLWQQTVQDFESGALDILVGTQTITKGYHFPGVTLVGILWADLNLHFPLYYAAENCLQQLIQVAGRAGRERSGAQVIVQTMMDHPIFKYINEVDYLKLYKQELEQREMVGYPPCMRLAEIELKWSNETQLEKEALSLVHHLVYEVEALELEAVVLGPAKPPVHKIKKMHARTLILKAHDMSSLIRLYKTISHAKYKSSIFFTPDPL